MGKRFEETSHQRKYTNKHWKRCPKSLVIREILMKTTMKYYSTCTKMAITKKTITTSVGKDMGNQKVSYISGVDTLKCCSHFIKVWQFL